MEEGGFCGAFFFSSRRRHTRYWRDWSSDVCSSDLPPLHDVGGKHLAACHLANPQSGHPRRSEERRVGKSVDLGGRRIIKKKKKQQNTNNIKINIEQISKKKKEKV